MDPVKIPFGYKRVSGQSRRGDAISINGKFVRVLRVYRKWPVFPDDVLLIRRCTVEQPELPGVSDASP